MLRVQTICLLVMCLVGVGTGSSTAQEPSKGADTASQRIEAPEAGVVLVVPEDWSFSVVMKDLSSMLLPDVADGTLWRVLDSWGPDGPFPGAGGCSVWSLRAPAASLDMRAIGDTVAYPRLFWDTLEYERTHTTTEVLLPIGPVTREDFVRGDDRVWEFATAIYTFAAPDGLVWLICGAPESPPDHWLSIAGSVEFTPAMTGVVDDDAIPACPDTDEPLSGQDPRLTREHLTHCETCEDLRVRLEYRRVPDLAVGWVVFSERCDEAIQIPWAYEEYSEPLEASAHGSLAPVTESP